MCVCVCGFFKVDSQGKSDNCNAACHVKLHFVVFIYLDSKLKLGSYLTAQDKPGLKSPLMCHLNKGELHPTGSLSGIFRAPAYVNPGSEAVSVMLVKTLFRNHLIQCRNEKHTLFRLFVIVVYSKYTDTCPKRRHSLIIHLKQVHQRPCRK